MDQDVKSFGQIMTLIKYILLIGAGSFAIYLGIYGFRCYNIEHSEGISPYEFSDSYKEGQYVKFANFKLDWGKKWIYSEDGKERYYFIPFQGTEKTILIFRDHFVNVEMLIKGDFELAETLSGFVTRIDEIPPPQYDLVVAQDLSLSKSCYVFEPRTPIGLGGAIFTTISGSLMLLFVLISLIVRWIK